MKNNDFCCTLLQFFVWCTLSDTVTLFQCLLGLNIYGPEAAAMIADPLTSSGRGLALLRNVLRLCATAKPVVHLEVNSLTWYATLFCTPRAAVCLSLEQVLGDAPRTPALGSDNIALPRTSRSGLRGT